MIRSLFAGIMLTPLAYLVMGLFGAINPSAGPIAFLCVQVMLGVYCLYRLGRGLLASRRVDEPLMEQAKRDVAFGLGSLVVFTAITVWVVF